MDDLYAELEKVWSERNKSKEKWLSSATSDSDQFSVALASTFRNSYFHGGMDNSSRSRFANRENVRLTSSSTYWASVESIDKSVSNYANARDLLYHWEHIDKGRVASVYAVFYVEKNFSDRNLEAVNSLLLTLSPKRLTQWSMVAVLRASFSAKHILPGWGIFLSAVKEELKDNDRRDRLLSGLED